MEPMGKALTKSSDLQEPSTPFPPVPCLPAQQMPERSFLLEPLFPTVVPAGGFRA